MNSQTKTVWVEGHSLQASIDGQGGYIVSMIAELLFYGQTLNSKLYFGQLNPPELLSFGQ